MACTKRIYPDKKAAVTARRAQARAGRRTEDELVIYECRRCGGWHMAKREKADMRRTRKERGERKARKHSRRDHGGMRDTGYGMDLNWRGQE